MWYKQIASLLKNKIKKTNERPQLEEIINHCEEVFFHNPDFTLKAQFFLVGLVIFNKLYGEFVLMDTPITCENISSYFNFAELIKIENREAFLKNAALSSLLDKLAKSGKTFNLNSLKNQLSFINIPLENKASPLTEENLDFPNLKLFFEQEKMPGSIESFFESSLNSLGKKASLDKFLQSIYELFHKKFKHTHKWGVNETAFINTLNNIIKTQHDKTSVSRPTFKLEIAAYSYLYHNYFKNYEVVKNSFRKVIEQNTSLQADFNQLSLIMSNIGFEVRDDLPQDEKNFLNKIKSILNSFLSLRDLTEYSKENAKKIIYQIIDEAIIYFQHKSSVNYRLFMIKANEKIKSIPYDLLKANLIKATIELGEIYERKMKNFPKDFEEEFIKFLNELEQTVAELKFRECNHPKLPLLEIMVKDLVEINKTYQIEESFHNTIRKIINYAMDDNLDEINEHFFQLIHNRLIPLLLRKQTVSNDKPLFSKEHELLKRQEKLTEKTDNLHKTLPKEFINTAREASKLLHRLQSCIDWGLKYKTSETYQAMNILCQKAITQFKGLALQWNQPQVKELLDDIKGIESALNKLSDDSNTSPKFFPKPHSPTSLPKSGADLKFK